VVSLRLPHLLKNCHLTCWAFALGMGTCLPALAERQSLSNPYYREVEFHRQQAQPLHALGSLLATQQRGLLDQNRNAADLLLGQLYRDYNLPGQATDTLQRASGSGVGSLRGKAWWELAQQRYQRGDYQRAYDALVRSTGLLPYELEQQRPLLQAHILIALNRNAEAAALLSGWLPIQQQDAYSRYNIGVALVRAGNLLEGAGMLDSVGTMPAPDKEQQSLRDQANLAMGYGFLRADHGATARPLFKRVQLQGPYSSLALLGAGWAELAPDGRRQQNLYLSPVGCVEDPTRVLPENLLVLRRPSREACDRERTFKSRVFFEQSPGAASEDERYRRALVPWLVLIQRTVADPAVQEALLAVPYAYSQLEARDQAIEHYRSAIQSYESERKSLQRTLGVLRTAPLADANAGRATRERQLSAWQLPRPQDHLYLGSLLASDPFQSALHDRHELLRLKRELGMMQVRLQALAGQLDGDASLIHETQTDATPVATRNTLPPPATGPRITYFGVFDFQPPAAMPDDAAPDSEDGGATDHADAESFAEPEPNPDPPITQRPRRATETPVQKHARLRARMDSLQQQISQAETAQERALRQMALGEIASQQARLDTYLAQARFSLARLLDPAATPSQEP
jgi:hypothetical protein